MHFPRPTSARQVVRRPAFIAGAALVLVLSLSTLLPDGGGSDGAITPSGDLDTTTGMTTAPGPTPMRPATLAEIDRVVARGASLPTARRTDLEGPGERARVAREVTRCADLEGQRYCLGVGWTTRSPAEVARSLARPSHVAGRERTGDLDPLVALARTARLSPKARARADRTELTHAAQAVGKVWQLRRDLEGAQVPAHLQASVAPSRPSTSYPRRSTVMRARHGRAQQRTYWCGPTTIQMITASAGKRRNQAFWGRRLRTTTAGTAITDMVRVVNNNTLYDSPRRAGRYIVLDISDYSFRKWFRLMMRHVHDYRAPVVLHPVLEKRFFPYLDDDASGHFQVGRGYDKNRGRPLLGFFEPWDQSRFDPSEPFIARVQWRNAYRSYRANQAHFQHNVGV